MMMLMIMTNIHMYVSASVEKQYILHVLAKRQSFLVFNSVD